MSFYEVGFPSETVQRRFEKEVARLDAPTLRRVQEAIEGLSGEPRPPGKKFKSLRPPVPVYQHVAQCRLRVGDFRILYDIDESLKKVVLLAIRRRSEKTYR